MGQPMEVVVSELNSAATRLADAQQRLQDGLSAVDLSVDQLLGAGWQGGAASTGRSIPIGTWHDMQLVLVIDIHGDVDQPRLDRLQSSLQLRKQGRLTDDWDQEFGYRLLDLTSGERVNIGLIRQFDNSWTLQVVADKTPDPESAELAGIRSELIKGVTAVGLQAAVRAKPTFGSADGS